MLKVRIPQDLEYILDQLRPEGGDLDEWVDAELASDASDFEEKHGDKHAAVRHVLEYYVSLRQ
jgi:hypothetical protein